MKPTLANRLREFGAPAEGVPIATHHYLVEHVAHGDCGCPASWVCSALDVFAIHDLDLETGRYIVRFRVAAMAWSVQVRHTRACRR